MEPSVSFVVPCYKLAHVLPDCLNSILAQTYSDFEILIMDNCSPDNTPEVAHSFGDSRVKHIRNEINVGHVRNFNKGINLARGKYVWLVSADDFLTSPHALNRYVDLMERNPQVGFVFCRGTIAGGPAQVGESPSWTDCGNEDRIWEGTSFLERLVWSNFIVMSSVMVRKECYERTTLFSVDLPYACDWYMWCVLALHYDVAYFSEVMACWRVHNESLTNAFKHEGSRVCIEDELDVLFRVAREAEVVGLPSIRRACDASIANRAARALKADAAGDMRSGLLSELDLEKIFQRNPRETKDNENLQALFSIALGDAEFWRGENNKAAQSYWTALKLRPLWLKAWVKYLLLWLGSAGIGVRRFVALVAATAGSKGYPGRS